MVCSTLCLSRLIVRSLTGIFSADPDLLPIQLAGATPLFEAKWRRIVLDEAHTARNPQTILYRAICGLSAERRWAITGTPIVNSTRDLGALAAWIGLNPFAEDDSAWARVIENPLGKGGQASQRAAGLLRAVVQVSWAARKLIS